MTKIKIQSYDPYSEQNDYPKVQKFKKRQQGETEYQIPTKPKHKKPLKRTR
jgi:hypothetical protein